MRHYEMDGCNYDLQSTTQNGRLKQPIAGIVFQVE